MEVTLNNSRQVGLIAKNTAITQTEWRNLMMAVFASTVNINQFDMTTDYRTVWLEVNHVKGLDNFKTEYTEK